MIYQVRKECKIMSSSKLVFALIGVFIATPLLAQSTQPAGDAPTMSYSSLLGAYRERGDDGVLRLPEKRVEFGEDTGKQFTLTITAMGKSTVCPVAFQDVAYLLDPKGTRGKQVLIFGYEGCPMPLPDKLEAESDIELREELRINITSAAGKVLWADPHTAVPFASNGAELFPASNFANVTWVLVKKGISFAVGADKYVADKDGAQIRFTKSGITFDGVTKIASASGSGNAGPASTQPSATQPASSENEQPKLIDGFISKEYTVRQPDLDAAMKAIFPKCVAVEQSQDGTTVTWGVGDKNGNWSAGVANWHGVATVNGLDIKEGGVLIMVKTVRTQNTVTVGFKVGDGDAASSEKLHKMLAELLKSTAR
jgi:hypothetical protein